MSKVTPTRMQGPQADGEVRRDGVRGGSARLRIRRERSGVWILNVVILLVLAFAAPNFFSLGNIAAVLNDAAILGIGAAGMTVLIMAGAFDLSVTAIMGLAPIVALVRRRRRGRRG